MRRVPCRSRNFIGDEAVMDSVAPAGQAMGASASMNEVPESGRGRGDGVVKERQVEENGLGDQSGEHGVVVSWGHDRAQQGGGSRGQEEPGGGDGRAPAKEVLPAGFAVAT